jgi:hypothetical protein
VFFPVSRIRALGIAAVRTTVTVAAVGRPASALCPQVDGSLGAWLYILMDLLPLHDPPALTLGGVFTLLPVVHKYVNWPVMRK